jgi:hypothetical protein
MPTVLPPCTLPFLCLTLAAWQSGCLVNSGSDDVPYDTTDNTDTADPAFDSGVGVGGTGGAPGEWPNVGGGGAGGQGMAGAETGGSAAPDSGPDSAPEAVADTAPPLPPPLDCSGIQAHAGWEVCETGPDRCAGVFTDGAGCDSYCAGAGLICVASYGAEPGCLKETSSFGCAFTGHNSNWCECGVPPGGVLDAGSPGPTCTTDPGNPQKKFEYDTGDAVFEQRHNWAVTCDAHAYTANNSEHQACDDEYNPDGSRKGKARFTFPNVPAGRYDVYVESKHTKNRNPAGALFYVNSHSKVINQVSDPSAFIWDLHGRYCLQGEVNVVLDSTVNGGSDAVSGVRLVPAP